jgi:hypothetical protein
MVTEPNETARSRRPLVVGLLTGLGVAVLLTPVLIAVTLVIGFGGNSSFGGLGAAAQNNTEWWARPAAYGAVTGYLVLAVGAGYLAARLSRRRAAAKARP